MHLQGSRDLHGMETSLLLQADSRILAHGKDGKGPRERKHKRRLPMFLCASCHFEDKTGVSQTLGL